MYLQMLLAGKGTRQRRKINNKALPAFKSYFTQIVAPRKSHNFIY